MNALQPLDPITVKGRPAVKRTPLQRFESLYMPEPNSGCWLWIGCARPLGYGQISFNCRPCAAHRVSWTLLRGEIPPGMNVLHKCDTPSCVNPDHLFLGTKADNSADMVRKKRSAAGSHHSQAKLTEAMALAILNDARPQHIIASEYKIGATSVHNIKRGKTWSHVREVRP